MAVLRDVTVRPSRPPDQLLASSEPITAGSSREISSDSSPSCTLDATGPYCTHRCGQRGSGAGPWPDLSQGLRHTTWSDEGGELSPLSRNHGLHRQDCRQIFVANSLDPISILCELRHSHPPAFDILLQISKVGHPRVDKPPHKLPLPRSECILLGTAGPDDVNDHRP